MGDTLWTKDLYRNQNIPFIFNTDIIEYDMKDAGFSLIKEFNLLDKKEIELLSNMEKMKRHITIGKMEKENKNLVEAKKECFSLARKYFFEANELERDDIISIKKDAIFTKKICRNQKFGKYIYFRPKNAYTSYINLSNKLEFFYNPSRLDIKGLSDEHYAVHEDYMIHFIKSFIHKMETESSEVVIGFLRRFVTKYKLYDLEIGYYRTFDHRSMFMMKDGSGEMYETYFENDKKDIDINYNYFNILMKLIQLPL